MPKVARVDDTVTVHECGGSNAVATGSPTVYAEGKQITRNDGEDSNTAHLFDAPPTCVPHTTTLSEGSPNVFVNGKKMGRYDDAYSCGVTISSGANTVFANGYND